jgi:hypothetical protein
VLLVAIAIPATPMDASAQEASAQLVVVTTPPGAAVEVDGRPAGRSPATVVDLLPGAHSIVVRGEGGSAQRVVDLAPGRSFVVELDVPAVQTAPSSEPASPVEPPSVTPAEAPAASLPAPVEADLGVVPTSVPGWHGGRQYDYGLVVGGGATFLVGLVLTFVGAAAIDSRGNEVVVYTCLPLGATMGLVGFILALSGLDAALVGFPGSSDRSGVRFGSLSPTLDIRPDGASAGMVVTW